MLHFHLLQVKNIKKETEDCISISFEVPLELKDTFRFEQGQSLTIRKTLNGTEARRNYSICTSPLDGELKVAIKRITGGLFSTWANEALRKGDYLEVMPPVGKFHTPLFQGQKKNYIAFAAGSGITPILSIIRTTLLTEPRSTFTLLYGNRAKQHILFRDELQNLKDIFISRFSVHHILSREQTDVPLNYGRINKDKCTVFFRSVVLLSRCHEFFICGPEEMTFSVRDFLVESGVPRERIHFELFTIPGAGKRSVAPEAQAASIPTGLLSKVFIKRDGITFDFDLALNGQSVLDGALQRGVDLPYACKGGVCCTCKAKLLEGSVNMVENWGLEPDEVAAGYILTCQAHPLTDRIVVDFDAK
ncbi:MAG: 1,2-phenylacetyl-CoA epoxidase subunit PaaE [Chitinophagaceae bacterium]